MGSSIKIMRVREGLTQGELARRIGVRQTAVSQWECGKTHPGVKNLHKLAKTLNCSIDALMYEDLKAEKDDYMNVE